MQDSIFKPVYSLKGLSDVLILSLLLAITDILSFIRIGDHLMGVFGLILLGVFCFWWSHLLVRRIVFTSSAFFIDRYIWLSNKIDYADVTDIGKTKIKTNRGNISFAGMSNADELRYLFVKLIEQDKIDKNQIESKVFNEEKVFLNSLLPSSIISIILSCFLFLFWPYYHYRYNWIGLFLSLCIIWIIVNSLVSWVIKKHLFV